VESITFHDQPWQPEDPPVLVAATYAELSSDGTVVSYETRSTAGDRGVCHLRWRDGVLAAVESCSRSSAGTEPEVDEFSFKYDEDGDLVLIRSAAQNRGIYRRPSRSAKAAARVVEDALVRAIADAVHDGDPGEPVCAVVLGFDFASLLPPLIGIQTERVRAALIERGELADGLEIWNPGDMPRTISELTLSDSAQDAIDEVNTYITMTDDERLFTSMQRRLAKRLHGLDWATLLGAMTDDFTVASLDIDTDELWRPKARARHSGSR
jgi:hypothetical protein